MSKNISENLHCAISLGQVIKAELMFEGGLREGERKDLTLKWFSTLAVHQKHQRRF